MRSGHNFPPHIRLDPAKAFHSCANNYTLMWSEENHYLLHCIQCVLPGGSWEAEIVTYSPLGWGRQAWKPTACHLLTVPCQFLEVRVHSNSDLSVPLLSSPSLPVSPPSPRLESLGLVLTNRLMLFRSFSVLPSS